MSQTFLETAKQLNYDESLKGDVLEMVAWTVIDGDDVNCHVRIEDVDDVDEARDLLLSFALFHMHMNHYVDKNQQQDRPTRKHLVIRGPRSDAG